MAAKRTTKKVTEKPAKAKVQKPSDSKAAIPVPHRFKQQGKVISARAARAMRLGVYTLHQGGLHSQTEISNLSGEAYKRMEKERE